MNLRKRKESALSKHLFSIIYEDNHLLIVDKPAGLPSQPDDSGDPSLDEEAKKYIRETYRKPGNVYLALTHRLDRPTSGLVVLAKTSKAAARMAELFRTRALEKQYLALIDCHAAPKSEDRLKDMLEPAPNGGMRIASEGTSVSGGKKERRAELAFKTTWRSPDRKRALLVVQLLTGVKHQIRCQLAWRGLPVVGDFRYGPFGRVARPEPVQGGRAILLHAARLEFEHPVGKKPMTLEAPLPTYWPACGL